MIAAITPGMRPRWSVLLNPPREPFGANLRSQPDDADCPREPEISLLLCLGGSLTKRSLPQCEPSG
jgi:hypothetical protein